MNFVLCVSEMLLQLLLVLLPFRSHAVPTLGIALPKLSESEDEGPPGLLEEVKGIEEMSDTLKKRFHDDVPLILRPSKSIATSEPNTKNAEAQVNSEHDDREEGARIVNIQGQKRNPVYPGAGTRKSIKLNKPAPTILIHDSYEPFHYSNFPRFVTCFSFNVFLSMFFSVTSSSSINLSGVTLTSHPLTTSLLNLKLTGECRMECSLLKLCGTYIPGSCLG